MLPSSLELSDAKVYEPYIRGRGLVNRDEREKTRKLSRLHWERGLFVKRLVGCVARFYKKGCRVSGVGCGVWGVERGVWGVGCRVCGVGCRV